MVFLDPGTGKYDFPVPSFFNDLRSSKMAVHPCTAYRPLKNGVFQQPVGARISP